MTSEEFWPLYRKNQGKIFKSQSYRPQEHMTAHERSGSNARRAYAKEQIDLYYGLFNQKNQMVGWCTGFQISSLDFYMMSSVVFPSYRRQGWYGKMVKALMKEVKRLGFQHVFSNHHPGNRAILIAKLGMGFVISGLEISDGMGTLVKLSYYLNPLREEVYRYRTGEVHPSVRVKKVLKLKK